MEVSLFSFFAGVGMMDLAFERSKFNIVLVNEYEKQFINAYKFIRNRLQIDEPIYGYYQKSAEYFSKRRGKKRLQKIMAHEKILGNVVGFIGGPPCPDFSVAGKNKGSHGENGRLTKTYFDIVCRNRPDFFVFENVKGLVRTEKHRLFYEEMRKKLSANGFVLSHSLLNSLSFGVPQFREREILIGINTNSFPAILAFSEVGEFQFPWEENMTEELETVLHQNWPTTQRFINNSRRINRLPEYEQLTVEYWFRRNDVYHHPNTYDRFKVRAGAAKIATIDEGDTTGKSFKRLHRWRYSPTACYGNNEVHLHPYKKRRLSVAEVMAIQSLPYDFCLPREMPRSLMFKTIGNGVPYLLAKGIAQSLFDFLCQLNKGRDNK